MKWISRILSVINGGLFAYWCGLGGSNPDWWLWAKFMTVSMLAFEGGQLYREAQLKQMGKEKSELSI